MNLQVTLHPYECSQGVAFPAAIASELAGLEVDGAKTPVKVSPSALWPGRYDLTATGYVGAITVGEYRIAIRPRFSMRSVAFMLGYAIKGARWEESTLPLDEDWSLNEVLVPGFCRAVKAALRPGALQGYQRVEDAIPGVRGRIRFDEQVSRRFGLMVPIEVAYDEFTEDIEVNRLIKAAIRRLLGQTLELPVEKRELRAFDAALANVANIEYDPTNLPQIQFNRLNRRYEDAVAIAKIILRASTIEPRHGNTNSKAFLVSMPWLFEAFVVRALREMRAWPDSVELVQGGSGKKLALDEGARIALKPDLSLWLAGDCVFVGDVKYKRTAPESAPNFDLYQLAAYATALDLPEGVLLYAAGEEAAGEYIVRCSGKRLVVKVLDVSGEPEEILSRLRVIAYDISQMARGIAYGRRVTVPA